MGTIHRAGRRTFKACARARFDGGQPRNWFLAGSGFAFKMQICVLIRVRQKPVLMSIPVLSTSPRGSRGPSLAALDRERLDRAKRTVLGYWPHLTPGGPF